MRKWVSTIALLFLGITFGFSATVQLWHGYRGQEKKAIEQVAKAFNLSHSDIQVQLLAVPFDALNDKLRATIPLNNGPDVFVFAQDFVGSWAENGIILPIESYLDKNIMDQYLPNTKGAFSYMYPGALWALPGSFKNIALYYNKALVKNPPQKMSELVSMAKKFTKPNAGQFGKWGFVYETGNFYYHTMWIQGFGGKIFRKIGTTDDGFPIFLPLLYSKPMVEAGKYVMNNIINQGICPPGPSGTLVTQLFNTGNAMFVINGQWFRAEIDKRINYGLSELPIIDEANRRAIPFLTVEGYFMSTCAKSQDNAIEVIKYFTSAAMGKVFAKIGKQTPANKGAYKYAVVKNDRISQIFKKAADIAKSMPNSPEMALTWDPGTSSLNDILGGGKPETVLKKRQLQLMKSIEQQKGRKLYQKYYRLNKLLPVD